MSSDPAKIEQLDAIDYRIEARPWPFAVHKRAAIDAHWKKLREENPRLFNGAILLMHRAAIAHEGERRILRGAAFTSDYKSFLAWRDFGFPDPDISNCFAMAALLSVDGAFMLGRMSPRTANAGKVYFPSGTPDLDDIKGDRIDLEGSLVRELFEETGIAPHEVTLERGWTIVFEGPRVACLKIARSALPAAEILARFERFIAADSEPELDALRPIFSLADLDEKAMPPFILAYLRHMLGDKKGAAT